MCLILDHVLLYRLCIKNLDVEIPQIPFQDFLIYKYMQFLRQVFLPCLLIFAFPYV